MRMRTESTMPTCSALTDPVPKARYRCGSSDVALCTLLEMLPIELVDSFLVSAFQPRSKAKSVPVSQGQNVRSPSKSM